LEWVLSNIVALGTSIEEVLDDVELNRPEPYQGYRIDVFGTTPEEAVTARSAQRDFFSDFMELSDEATVRFVAGQKDTICESCVVGGHCEAISPKADSIFLKAIGRLAREKGIEDVLTETEVEIKGWKKPNPVIELPAWAARSILGDLSFHELTVPRILRPLARQSVRRAIKDNR
jgi:hypothetical protein